MTDEIPFAQSILHTTDFSPASHQAFAHALAIALVRQSELTVLHCGPEGTEEIDWESFPPVRETLEKWALLESGSEKFAVWERLKLAVTKRFVTSQHPALAAADFLRDSPHDLVVLATESRSGFERLIQHSTAETIARWSRANTLFVPSDASRGLVDLDTGAFGFTNILVAVDETPNPDAAVEYARRAADLLGHELVTITVLHAGDTLPDLPPITDGARWRWQVDLRKGKPKAAILDCASETQAELIVMTSGGVNSVLDAFRGNISEQVVRQSECPVLVVASDT